uniref:Cell wall-active antibiotics response LiaF-like C-terminal domain-containing protein n=2 Tax=Cohnella candidum TaxID=2674991 RepID=A0A3G3K5A2_9BACL|nr:hypothetical protein EAV92_13870 [Cohnella candidum]
MGWFEWNLGDLFSMIGPVILILVGISMMARGSRPKRDRRSDDDSRHYGWNPVTPPPVPPVPPAPSAPPQGPPPAPPLTDDPGASFTDAGRAYPPPPPGPTEGRSSPEGAPIFRDERRDRYHERMERYRERMERREMRWKRHHGHGNWRHYDPHAAQHHRFIGDVHIGQDYWELKPMNISHFIGDTTLDLTKAQIPLGETRIYVSCFIGDVKVFVPNDLSIGVQVVSSSLIGDVRVWDHRRGGFFNHMSVETPSYADTEKRVVLVASSFIGDVRVTKVG